MVLHHIQILPWRLLVAFLQEGVASLLQFPPCLLQPHLLPHLISQLNQILNFGNCEFTVGVVNLKTPLHLQNFLAANRRVLLPLLTPVPATWGGHLLILVPPILVPGAARSLLTLVPASWRCDPWRLQLSLWAHCTRTVTAPEIVVGKKSNSSLMHVWDFGGCFIPNYHLGSYACLVPVSEACRLRPQEIGLCPDSCDSFFLVLISLKYWQAITNFITMLYKM